MSARRFDIAQFGRAELLPNGFLKAPAVLSRTGVFSYTTADGTVRRELRPPEEVFHPDALASCAMLTITLDHPTSGFVTSENAKHLTVGHLGENVVQDGNLVRATAMITDDDAIAKVRAGKRQLSLGYVADVEHAPGVWNGEHYDAVQRNIRCNHVSIVERGRAGPVASLQLDAADAVALGPEETNEMDTTVEELRKRSAAERAKFKADAETAWMTPLAAGTGAGYTHGPRPVCDSAEAARRRDLEFEELWKSPLTASKT